MVPAGGSATYPAKHLKETPFVIIWSALVSISFKNSAISDDPANF